MGLTVSRKIKSLSLYPRFVISKVSRSLVKAVYVSGLVASAATTATHSALVPKEKQN